MHNQPLRHFADVTTSTASTFLFCAAACTFLCAAATTFLSSAAWTFLCAAACVPKNYAGIYSSGRRDRMGCEIPKVIKFRAFPENVQDRAEILPTMWPRYRISGYERLFHYRLMTVMRRAMIYKATCHSLSPGAADNMYLRSVDRSIGTGSIHWRTLQVGLQNRLINWSLPPLSVQSRFSTMPVPSSQELTSSTPTSWTCFCSRTWALVASLRSSLAG